MPKKVVTRRQRKAAEAKRAAEEAASEPQKWKTDKGATSNGNVPVIGTNVPMTSSSTLLQTVNEKKPNLPQSETVDVKKLSPTTTQTKKASTSKLPSTVPAAVPLTTKSGVPLAKFGKKMIEMVNENSRQKAAKQAALNAEPHDTPNDNDQLKSKNKSNEEKSQVPPNVAFWAKLRSEFLRKNGTQIEDSVLKNLIQSTLANDPDAMEIFNELSQFDLDKLIEFIRNTTVAEMKRELDLANSFFDLESTQKKVANNKTKKRKANGSAVKPILTIRTDQVVIPSKKMGQSAKKTAIVAAKDTNKMSNQSHIKADTSSKEKPSTPKKHSKGKAAKQTKVQPPMDINEPPTQFATDVTASNAAKAPCAIGDQLNLVSAAVDFPAPQYIGNTGYFILTGSDELLNAQLEKMSLKNDSVSMSVELPPDVSHIVNQQLEGLLKNREKILAKMHVKHDMHATRTPRVKKTHKYSKN